MRNSENLEGEVWKQHPIGIMVSNLGRVETERKGKNYGSKNSTPYLQVNWQGKKYKVHRLICEAFHPNEDNLPCVNHKDENPRNNRADNLEWCSYSYNNTYGTAIERRVKNTDWETRTAKIDYKAIGEKNAAKLSIPILQLNKNLQVVREWKSLAEAQREGGFHQQNICACLKGRHKTCGGYVWRYKNEGTN